MYIYKYTHKHCPLTCAIDAYETDCINRSVNPPIQLSLVSSASAGPLILLLPRDLFLCLVLRIDGYRMRYWYRTGTDQPCTDAPPKFDANMTYRNNDESGLCRELLKANNIVKPLSVAYVSRMVTNGHWGTMAPMQGQRRVSSFWRRSVVVSSCWSVIRSTADYSMSVFALELYLYLNT